MINRRIAIFALVVVLVFTSIAVGRKFVSKKIAKNDDEIEIISSDDDIMNIVEEEGMRKTVLYFQNSEGFLVPVMRRIPWEEGIAKLALKNMIDTPELREVLGPTGLLPIIPSGTEINGMSVNPDTGICKVDFNEEILNKESLKDEENLIKGVVYTLTEFPAVKGVQIFVNGEEVSVLKNGTKLDKSLTREDINLLGSDDDGRSKIVVYFKGQSEGDFEYFITVTIPTLAPVANVYTALDLLFEGPPEDSGLYSDIPRSVNFKGVEIKESTAYVDVNLGDENMLTREATLNEIVKDIGLTLSQFSEIESVELLVDGEVINTSIPTFANEY